MASEVYPPFVRPAPLDELDPRVWTKGQAAHYFDWVLEVESGRRNYLLNYFDLDSSMQLTVEFFDELGSKVFALIAQPGFYETKFERKFLNESGNGLGVDVGLVVAHQIVRDGDGIIRWELWKGAPSDISFNQPVLVGFDAPFPYWNPIRGGYVQCNAMLNHEKDAWAITRMYKYWKSFIPTAH